MDAKHIDLHEYELVVFDIDGTIAGSDHVIRPFTKATLTRLRSAGIPFTLATGKSLPGTIEQAGFLDVDLPMVLINGGMLQKRDGAVLHTETLPVDAVEAMVGLCERQDCDLVMYSGDGIFYKEMNANLNPVYGHLSRGMNPIGNWRSISDRFSRINKYLIVDTTNQENLFRFEAILKKTLKNDVQIFHSSNVLLEVMPRDVNKVTGLKQLSKIMHISLSQVMAFGNYDNDVEMLSGVGLGVAVANASARAKEAADLIIGDVENEGPALFLANLLDRLPGTN